MKHNRIIPLALVLVMLILTVSSVSAFAAYSDAQSDPRATMGLKNAWAGYFMVGNVNTQNNDAKWLTNFNIVTAENYMKPNNLTSGSNSSNPTWTWTNGNTVANWAINNNVKLHGHTLIWGKDSQGKVAWLNNTTTITRAQAKINMELYIKTVTQHFDALYPAGQHVYSWDVINELFQDDLQNVPTGNWDWRTYVRATSEDAWRARYGNGMAAGENNCDYVYDAFLFARQYTDALLIYNDFNMYRAGKVAAATAMAKELNAKYAAEHPEDPRKLVEIIGMQGHLYIQESMGFTTRANSAFTDVAGLNLTNISALGTTYPWTATLTNPANVSSMENGIQEIISAGLDVAVSELDLQAFYPYNGNQNVGGSTTLNNYTNANLTSYWQSRLNTAVGGLTNGALLEEIQGYRMAEIFAVFKKYSNYIDHVTIWGMHDNNSWRAYQRPLLWDYGSSGANARAKRAYYGAAAPEAYLGIGEIEPFPRYEILDEPIADFEALVPYKSLYTSDSWDVAQTAYNAAKATQTTTKTPSNLVSILSRVQGETDALIEAIENLELVVPVTGITGIPGQMLSTDSPLTLAGVVAPTDATNQTIVWTIEDAGTTGATISGNALSATDSGTLTLKATIVDGLTDGDFVDYFDIDVMVPVSGITGIPGSAFVGTVDLSAAVVAPANATNQTIVWQVVDPDTTGATISGDTLTTTGEGTVTIKATIENGADFDEDYEQTFDIVISYNPGSDLTLSSPDVLMIKKGAYAYVSVFTDATASKIKTSFTGSFISVAPVGGPTVQCINALKAGTTVLTFYADVDGGASKTIVVIVN